MFGSCKFRSAVDPQFRKNDRSFPVGSDVHGNGKLRQHALPTAVLSGSSADVVNLSLVTDPAVQCTGPPRGFCIPISSSVNLLNHFRTGQGRCVANLIRRCQSSETRAARVELQKHIVDVCQLTRSLASPAMGHGDTCPLDFQQYLFLVNFGAA